MLNLPWRFYRLWTASRRFRCGDIPSWPLSAQGVRRRIALLETSTVSGGKHCSTAAATLNKQLRWSLQPEKRCVQYQRLPHCRRDGDL